MKKDKAWREARKVFDGIVKEHVELGATDRQARAHARKVVDDYTTWLIRNGDV